MPNWEGSDRRHTLPLDWAVTVLRILRRDLHRCQWIRYDTGRRCLAQASDVDHIIRPADGGSEDDSNLQALCKWHHNRKSGREGGLASGKSRRAKRDEGKPLHPGLLAPDENRPTRPVVEDPPPF